MIIKVKATDRAKRELSSYRLRLTTKMSEVKTLENSGMEEI